jgi:DNA-binding response OmpR family regulator
MGVRERRLPVPLGPSGSASGRIEPPHPGKVVTVLLVSAAEADHRSLGHLFHHTNWTLLESWNCTEALQLLRSRDIPVVICDCRLPDGAWADILQTVRGLPRPPLLIVSSRLADDCLWAEVMNAGAWDILEKPFNQAELVRVVSLAWLAWKGQFQRAAEGDQQANTAS